MPEPPQAASVDAATTTHSASVAAQMGFLWRDISCPPCSPCLPRARRCPRWSLVWGRLHPVVLSSSVWGERAAEGAGHNGSWGVPFRAIHSRTRAFRLHGCSTRVQGEEKARLRWKSLVGARGFESGMQLSDHEVLRLYSRHSSGTPFSAWCPRSSKLRPDPATRSLTVEETRTSEGRASAATRAPI